MLFYCWRKCEEKETVLHCGRTVNWYSRYEDTLKTRNINYHMTQQSHYSAYTWENHISKRHIFTAALFTTARTWRQCRCPSTDEWINKLWCTVAQSCPTLCNPVDCSPPGSSVHGIFPARILEWVIVSYSRRSSPSRNWTCVSCISCIGRQVLYR